MKTLKFKDRVYGEIVVSDPVLLEIIKSPSFQRLKGINQIGYPKPFFHNPCYSRFEHSLGVYWLLSRYQTSIEEQTAGLIHDLSHSVFSHSIDYVLDEGSPKEHSHQDNIFKSFVQKSTVSTILKKHHFDLDHILNDKNFPLKERPLPQLCADRIDYTLRNAIIYRKIKNPFDFINQLKVIDGQWVFDNLVSAQRFAVLFLKLNRRYYSAFASASMFRTVSDYLRYGLIRKYINRKDLYLTDAEVLLKLKKFHRRDAKLSLLFSRMGDTRLTHEGTPNSGVEVFCKSRMVDPPFLKDGKIVRLSVQEPRWQGIIKEELKPKRYFLKFVN